MKMNTIKFLWFTLKMDEIIKKPKRNVLLWKVGVQKFKIGLLDHKESKDFVDFF